MKKYEKEYRQEINKYLQCGEDTIFFYWKGRVALYALLKAMGVGAGDEVIVQGYTCVVVPNAILYLGATPIYADIDLDTYNMNLDSLKSRITEKTKVIICQNTYGLSSNLEKIEEIAKRASEKYGHYVYTIEDCTHGFSGTYHGKPNGTKCDASFFSTQWNKPYTTGVGGFSVIHNEEIKQKVIELEKEKIQPSKKETLELRLMYFVRQYIINDFTYWPMIRLYRWLSKKNIVVGSSSGEETSSIEMPKDFFKDQSSVQFKKGIKSIKNLDEINKIRKSNAEALTKFLKENNKTYVKEELFDDHIFIRYPLLVKDRDKFKEEAEKASIILGEWFEQPIYPCYSDMSLWKVKEEEIPNGVYASKYIVNALIDTKKALGVKKFIKDNLSIVL